jgi:hypothetical protein
MAEELLTSREWDEQSGVRRRRPLELHDVADACGMRHARREHDDRRARPDS